MHLLKEAHGARDMEMKMNKSKQQLFIFDMGYEHL